MVLQYWVHVHDNRAARERVEPFDGLFPATKPENRHRFWLSARERPGVINCCSRHLNKSQSFLRTLPDHQTGTRQRDVSDGFQNGSLGNAPVRRMAAARLTPSIVSCAAADDGSWGLGFEQGSNASITTNIMAHLPPLRPFPSIRPPLATFFSRRLRPDRTAIDNHHH